jgi:hypothetical protein
MSYVLIAEEEEEVVLEVLLVLGNRVLPSSSCNDGTPRKRKIRVVPRLSDAIVG